MNNYIKTFLFQNKIREETILFLSVIKWVILATIVGIAVGLVTVFFLKTLAWSVNIAKGYEYYFLLIPVAFFLSSLMIKELAPDAEGHGTEKVIEAVHKRAGRIKPIVVPIKLVATVITIALGGSVGKEGPCAQIGAGVSSLFADIFKFDDRDRKKLVICGISAGFASVFGTPIAGSIFGVEVLFIGTVMYDVLLPSFIAGIISFQVSRFMGITYFYHPISLVPSFNEYWFIIIIGAGIFFGLVGLFLIEILKYGERLSKKINIYSPLKGFIGGSIIVILALLISKDYLGLGLNTIESCLNGHPTQWYSFLLKPIFTSLTLNFGGSGGIVTVIFFTGATAGAFFAFIFGLDIATFSAIGMVSVVAGAANTPIAASIMAVELFGPGIAPYATVACVISYLMVGHRSVYPSQILSIKKSPSLQVEIGKEIEDISAIYKLNRKSKLIIKILSNIKRFEEIFRRNAPDNNSNGDTDSTK